MNANVAEHEGARAERQARARASRQTSRDAFALSESMRVEAESRLSRLSKRRVAIAIAIVLALHLAALYWLTASTVPIELTSTQGAAPEAISVSLVAAAPPSPTVQKLVTPPVDRPPQRPVTKPAKSVPVLATHRVSTRSITQQQDASPAPSTPPAASPQAAPESSSAQATAASSAAPAADSGKLMELPKAIDSSALRQLGCRIPQPVYPARAHRLGETGAVRIQIRIGTDGHFSDVHVVGGSGYPDLDSAALDAISAGSCEPYRQNGVALAVTAVQPISFNLGD
jgi:periplasmic protein TonB